MLQSGTWAAYTARQSEANALHSDQPGQRVQHALAWQEIASQTSPSYQPSCPRSHIQLRSLLCTQACPLSDMHSRAAASPSCDQQVYSKAHLQHMRTVHSATSPEKTSTAIGGVPGQQSPSTAYAHDMRGSTGTLSTPWLIHIQCEQNWQLKVRPQSVTRWPGLTWTLQEK